MGSAFKDLVFIDNHVMYYVTKRGQGYLRHTWMKEEWK
jgi:hypothetical protein